MAVPLAEVFAFFFEKLLASNPSTPIHMDALPIGVESGIVYRFTGAPVPSHTQHGEVLCEDMVIEVAGVGLDFAQVVEMANGIRVALTDQRGTTTDGEVFGVIRELPVNFPRRMENGQTEYRLGWKWRAYARAD